MRNEKTHFYGYLQTPAGHAFGNCIATACSFMECGFTIWVIKDPPPHWFMGHRIESLNLDLMNALPLPERNPQDLWMLKQGEIKSWTIVLMDINPLGEFEHVIHKATGIPMISIDRTTYVPGRNRIF